MIIATAIALPKAYPIMTATEVTRETAMVIRMAVLVVKTMAPKMTVTQTRMVAAITKAVVLAPVRITLTRTAPTGKKKKSPFLFPL
jgi:hypothetical protein